MPKVNILHRLKVPVASVQKIVCTYKTLGTTHIVQERENNPENNIQYVVHAGGSLTRYWKKLSGNSEAPQDIKT